MQEITMKKELSDLLLSMREKTNSTRYQLEHLYFDEKYLYATNRRIAGRIARENFCSEGSTLENGVYKVMLVEKKDKAYNCLYLEPLVDVEYPPDMNAIFKVLEEYTPEKTFSIGIPTKKAERNQMLSETIAYTAILSDHESCCDYTYLELLKGFTFSLSYNQPKKQFYFVNEDIDIIILPLRLEKEREK